MSKHLILAAVLLALPFQAIRSGDRSGGKGDSFIYPDPGRKILLVREIPSKDSMIAGEIMDRSPLAQKVMKELELPFHQSVLKLNQCSRNLAGNTQGPNVLFLSSTEGGFPRHGLKLKTKDSVMEYPSLNYVDLVLDEDRLASGALMIYSHELGHVMMANILEDAVREGRSPKQHVSMGVTDQWLAFTEGWGEHFQRLVLDQTPEYERIRREGFDYTRLNRLWHSKIDEDLRLEGVLRNIYICQKLLPQADTSTQDQEGLILREHTSPIFDPTRLKNAQQMLSSEGVIATLFYRIETDSVLQNNWLKPEFYAPFLLSPLPRGTKPGKLFTPFENVMLKDFWVFRTMRSHLTDTSNIFTEFIHEWCIAFPADREEITKLFLLTTAGRTVSEDLVRPYQEMARAGILGDIREFRSASAAFMKAYDGLKKRVLSGETAIDSNVGPQLWIVNPRFSIRTTLWAPDEKKPLAVDLNTASAYELATFPGMNLDRALAVVKARDLMGFFRSIGEAKEHGWTYEGH